MLDLSAIIQQAKEAPRQTVDVEVLFDTGIAKRLERLQDDQAGILGQVDQIDGDLAADLAELDTDARAGDGRPDQARTAADDAKAPLNARLDELGEQIAAVEAEAAEFLVTFRFTALHGFEWADLCEASQPREGNQADLQHGYNTQQVPRMAAVRTGARVGDDGETVAVSADEWKAVWETLPPSGLRDIEGRVMGLNEYGAIAARRQAVVAARKVSAARQAATPPLPSDSVSTPAV